MSQYLEPDHSLVRTNPVFASDHKWSLLRSQGCAPRQLQSEFKNWLLAAISHGVEFPESCWRCRVASQDLDRSNGSSAVPRRIVGLLHASGDFFKEPVGLVTEVRAEKHSQHWTAAAHLPFRWEHIQEALIRLLYALLSSGTAAFPESQAFSITSPLSIDSDGSSMNIAGLLAVIDAFNDHQPVGNTDLFRGACSLVRPVEDKLETVGYAELKLAAFKREIGRGSLLVCSPSLMNLECHRENFDEVWLVEDYASLAKHMSEAGLLGKVLEQRPLTLSMASEARGTITRIRQILGEDAAWNTAKRLGAAIEQATVQSERVKQLISEALEDSSRHYGMFADAVKYSQRALTALEDLGEYASIQEFAAAKTRLAAALFDAHCFEEAEELLSPLVEEIRIRPQIIPGETRVMVLNTYARIQIILARDGWEELLRRSGDIQAKLDPENQVRTRSYLIQGLMRSNRLNEAKAEIDWCLERAQSLDSFSRTFLAYYAAELYRRDSSIGPRYREDSRLESVESSYGCGHALSFYWQATARQPDRTSEDRLFRLAKAINVLDEIVAKTSEWNLLLLLKLFFQYASQDSQSEALASIHKYLNRSETSSMRNWYASVLSSQRPDAEQLLESFPYL